MVPDGDIDLDGKRVRIRHHFDKEHHLSTRTPSPRRRPGVPRAGGGIITSALVNDALTHGCRAAGLPYRSLTAPIQSKSGGRPGHRCADPMTR